MAFIDDVSAEELRDLYLTEQLSARDISNFYTNPRTRRHYSESTVRAALRHYHITKRVILSNTEIETRMHEALFKLDRVSRKLADLIPVAVTEDGTIVVNDYVGKGYHEHGNKRIKNYDFPIEMHLKVNRYTGKFEIDSAELRGRNMTSGEQRTILQYLNR